MSWWLEAGVDCALAEEPRNWFEPAPSAARPAAPAKDEPNVRIPEPETLEALKDWLAPAQTCPWRGRARAAPYLTGRKKPRSCC